jgi:membrane protease YdiL (CAAX protease family)
MALHAGQAFGFGLVWACAFLFVGSFEEGSFRCYLLFTLKRGINFWWALAMVAGVCLLLAASRDPKGSSGVFLIAALGVIPCGLSQRLRQRNSPFWQASWATSVAFGYFHTSNNGENAIGVFAAALIGFAFCVSVRVTGSAWWAIGCHAAWDWAETFFYGTPDSGFVAQRHFLTTSPVGNVLWSGGADGPEGSLLVVPVILLLLAALFVVFGRREPETLSA